jgi:hypothetical protein
MQPHDGIYYLNKETEILVQFIAMDEFKSNASHKMFEEQVQDIICGME